MAQVISLKDVTVVRGGKKILDAVDWNVDDELIRDIVNARLSELGMN